MLLRYSDNSPIWSLSGAYGSLCQNIADVYSTSSSTQVDAFTDTQCLFRAKELFTIVTTPQLPLSLTGKSDSENKVPDQAVSGNPPKRYP